MAEQATSIVAIPAGSIGFAGGADGGGMSLPVPFAQRIVLIEDIHVAGTTHVEDIDSIVADMSEGQELVFERDPGNLHDSWAIRVLAGGKRIGWVPVDSNEILARLMDGGKCIGATVTAMELRGRWHKIHMEVYLDD